MHTVTESAASLPVHCRAAPFSFGSIPQDNPFKAAQASAPSQAALNGKTAGEDVINLASDSSMTSPSEVDEEVKVLCSALSYLHSVACVQYLSQ